MLNRILGFGLTCFFTGVMVTTLIFALKYQAVWWYTLLVFVFLVWDIALCLKGIIWFAKNVKE